MPSVIKFNKKRRRSFFKINFIDVRFISTIPLTVWSSLRFAICVNVMFYLCINGNPSTLHWPSIDYKILWLYDGWSQWHKKYELRAKTLKAVFKKAMNSKCMHYSVFSTCKVGKPTRHTLIEELYKCSLTLGKDATQSSEVN